MLVHFFTSLFFFRVFVPLFYTAVNTNSTGICLLVRVYVRTMDGGDRGMVNHSLPVPPFRCVLVWIPLAVHVRIISYLVVCFLPSVLYAFFGLSCNDGLDFREISYYY